MTFPHPDVPRFEQPPPADRMFDHGQFTADGLAEHKGATSVTVALPARDAAATVGPIVSGIRAALVDRVPLVDELLVVDDRSNDDTAAIAADAGATVIGSDDILPDYGSGGKGEALWKSLYVSSGDVIIWCDADIRNFDDRFILGCLGPLLTNDDIGFVKGFYRRPLSEDGEGGGRVTELMARPLIAALFPHLDLLVQPLSGEFGGRRSLLEAVPFHRGYAVDLGLLIDLSTHFGIERIAQVDLGARVHRNRPLRQLGPQATAILAMALRRSHIGEDHRPALPDPLVLRRPEFGDAEVSVGELPPMATVRRSPTRPRPVDHLD